MTTRPPATVGGAERPVGPAAAGASARAEAPRTVVVTPDEVWSAPRDGGPPATPGPEPVRQGFAAPILLVTALSAALLALALAFLTLVLWLRR